MEGEAMIKPYIKHLHTATIVEVEDFGVIDLRKLPIRVYEDQPGLYEISFMKHNQRDGTESYILTEAGGSNMMNYGGRHLGVLRIIE